MPRRRATARSRPLVAPALLAALLATSTRCAGGAPSDAVPSTLTTRLGAVTHHHGHHRGPPRSVDCQYSVRPRRGCRATGARARCAMRVALRGILTRDARTRLPVQDRATGASWDFRQLSLPLSAYVFHDEMVRAANPRVRRAAAPQGAAARQAPPRCILRLRSWALRAHLTRHRGADGLGARQRARRAARRREGGCARG